jgi:hypothetical protein
MEKIKAKQEVSMSTKEPAAPIATEAQLVLLGEMYRVMAAHERSSGGSSSGLAGQFVLKIERIKSVTQQANVFDVVTFDGLMFSVTEQEVMVCGQGGDGAGNDVGAPLDPIEMVKTIVKYMPSTEALPSGGTFRAAVKKAFKPAAEDLDLKEIQQRANLIVAVHQDGSESVWSQQELIRRWNESLEKSDG